MGRRHFEFGPVPRAKQVSLGEAANVVKDMEAVSVCRLSSGAVEADLAWRPSRRVFPGPKTQAVQSNGECWPNQAFQGDGATRDTFAITPKRHTEKPPSFKDPNYVMPSSVKRLDDVEHKPSTSQEPATPAGKRHVQGGQDHFEGGSPQVARSDLPRRSCRRHVEDPCSKPRSRTEVNKANFIALQRRHLTEEDHLTAHRVSNPPPASRPQGRRCSSASPTHLDTGTAAAIQNAAAEASKPPTPQALCEPRRRFDMEDNLVGGTLRGPRSNSNPAVAPRPSRRPGRDMSSLHGGQLRYITPTARHPSPSRRAKENYEGGRTFWPGYFETQVPA
eukprot:TRINITY_DN114606_c0_g1_i1.p1 TRINITY_DN114606_c0_g1~~TRINITY_DN114606_c0_g1_i1.p1  ORF type:complete len:333 (+),score=31.01 TRINITY_DN114606_c0_g1_i1:97-1095(+)